MTAFDDRGAFTESVGFPYEEVEAHLAGILDPSVQHPTRQDNSIQALQTVLEWIVQKVPKNENGLQIRATIAAWIFLPYLRGNSLTEMAAMIGRDKQSLGRWVDDFKKRFPGVYHNGK